MNLKQKMKGNKHMVLKSKSCFKWKCICVFFVLLNCNSFAQKIKPQGTYVSGYNHKNTFIIKKNHTFIYYWYGETYMQASKKDSLRFTGKGTWVLKKDTIAQGLALFLEFTETKGTGSFDQNRIEK